MLQAHEVQHGTFQAIAIDCLGQHYQPVFRALFIQAPLIQTDNVAFVVACFDDPVVEAGDLVSKAAKDPRSYGAAIDLDR